MTSIHPTAILEDGAEIAENVIVGAYAFMGSGVKVGSGTRIHHHAIVEGNSVLGRNNEIFPFAYVGGKTQDLKYGAGDSRLEIGDQNVFREFSTVHCSTNAEFPTRIGNHNHIFAYAHVGHDCILHDSIIISSGTLLGGHVEVDSFANVGGQVAIHQYCKVGSYALVGGGSALVQDLLPFMIAEGNRARVRAYNKIGLQRHGFSEEQILQIRKTFKYLYGNELNHSQAFEKIIEDSTIGDEIKKMLLQFRVRSTRGLA